MSIVDWPSLKQAHLDMSVNFLCDQKCVFCSEWDKETFRFLRKKTLSDQQSFIRKARDGGYGEIMFSGGEPTMHPDLLAYMRYARECGFQSIGLITNGGRLIDPIIRSGIGDYVNHLIVSLHGSHAEMHDMITRTPWAFARAMSWIIAMKQDQACPDIMSVSFVLNRINLADLYRAAYLCLDRMWLDRFLVNTMRPDGYGGSKFHGLTIRYDAVISYFSSLPEAHKARIVRWITEGKIIITDIPRCILVRSFPDLDPSKMEYLYGRMQIVETNQQYEGIRRFDNLWQKRFAPMCVACRDRGVCEGVYMEYLETFGDGELWLNN